MNSWERVTAIIEGKKTDRCALINPVSNITAETCRATDVRFCEAHLDADKMAALAAYPYENLGFDSIMPYFSVVQEAAALGAEIDWGEGNVMPQQKGPVFKEPAEIEIPDDFLDRRPVRTVIDAISLLKRKYGGKAYIIGKVMGPWTLSFHLVGIENFLTSIADDPEKVDNFLSRLKTITMAFAEAQLEAGADAVTLADHITSDLVGVQTYVRFLLDIHRKINKVFSDKMLILHCCGNTNDRVSCFAQAGFKMFHFESRNNLKLTIEKAGDMMLTGCINNPDVLLNGNTTAVRESVKQIMNAGIRLISPECAVPMGVRNENLLEVSKTVREGCQYECY